MSYLYIRISQWSSKHYIQHNPDLVTFQRASTPEGHDALPPRLKCQHKALLSIMFFLLTPYCTCSWLLPNLNQWIIHPNNHLLVIHHLIHMISHLLHPLLTLFHTNKQYLCCNIVDDTKTGPYCSVDSVWTHWSKYGSINEISDVPECLMTVTDDREVKMS